MLPVVQGTRVATFNSPDAVTTHVVAVLQVVQGGRDQSCGSAHAQLCLNHP